MENLDTSNSNELKLVHEIKTAMQTDNEVLEVTSVEDIVKYSSGSVVKLPGFGEGEEFVAILRRPSMLKLMKNGAIPNSLMGKAQELFQNGSKLDTSDENAMKSMFEIMEVIAENTLVKPKYSEILEQGGELTDEQLIAIFSYSQNGVKALENFR